VLHGRRLSVPKRTVLRAARLPPLGATSQGREGDPHGAVSASTTASHVRRSASTLPARPQS
jgi:hypothetical protein